MSGINNIRSIQNLSSVNHPNPLQTTVGNYNAQTQLVMQLYQQHLQSQHALLMQQQHQQLQQQLQQGRQQHQLQSQQHPHQNQQPQNQQLPQQQQQRQQTHQQQIEQQPQQQQQQQQHQKQQKQQKQNQRQPEPQSHQTQVLPNRQGNASATNGRSTSNSREPKNGLVDLITCKLCRGYLIDAVTLDLCMHSFCRPCAIRYIREKQRCPECNVEIKDKRFLNRLKPDATIQNIVYKLVPGLYEKEMARRRKFYASRPSPTPRYKSEMFGDIPPSKTIKPDDSFQLSLTSKSDLFEEPFKIHIYCNADTTIQTLRKLIIEKLGLEKPIKFYYGNSEIFFDQTTLMEVASTFNWSPDNKILNLSFTEEEDEKEGRTNQVSSLPLMNSVLDP